MKPRVLVVDDDSALAEMLGIVLRTDQFEPVFVADGSRALQAFRETETGYECPAAKSFFGRVRNYFA